jgi:tetratricopeptide (TPR) repeat protein
MRLPARTRCDNSNLTQESRVFAARNVNRLPVLLVCGAVLIAAAAPIARGQSPASAPVADPARAGVPLAQVVAAPPVTDLPEEALRDNPALEARYAAALEAVENNKLPLAIGELSAALQLMRGPVYDVYLLLGRVRLQLGQLGEARLAAERAVTIRPTDPAAQLLLGRIHKRAGRLEAAVAWLRRATLAPAAAESESTTTLAWYELGAALEDAGYALAASAAFAEFDRAVWTGPAALRADAEIAALLADWPHGTLERQLDLLRRAGRPADAVRAAERARAAQPADAMLERLYVRALLDADQAGRAFDYCRERVRAMAEDDAELPALVGLAIEAGRASGGLTAWIADVAADNLAGRRAALGAALLARLEQAGETALTAPLWRARAAAAPDAIEPAWALAGALRAAGDLRGALDALIAFVQQNAEQATIPGERLATWMRGAGAADEFLKIVPEYTGRGDLDFATATVLGVMAAGAGQTDLAERLFQTALERRPDFTLAQVAWARLLSGQYRWEAALEHADAALRSAPRAAAAHAVRALALSGLDRYDDAEKAYKAALEAAPQDAASVLELARHYRRTGNLLAAQRYLQEAWALDHTRGDALEELVESYLEGGKVEIARSCLKEAETAAVSDDVLRRIRTTVRFAGALMQPEHIAELQRQFAEHPDDVTTGLKLAAGLYLRQRADEALPVVQQVQARAPADERLPYLRARIHARRLERDAAIALLETEARHYPRRLATLRQLADAYLADFRVAEAQRVLRNLLTMDVPAEQRAPLRSALLSTYVEFGDYEPALTLLHEWAQREPNDPNWAATEIRVLTAAERHDEAIALAEAQLAPVTARFNALRDQYRELTEREENDAGAAQLERVEREITPLLGELQERRAAYIETLLSAARYDPAEEQVRAWLVAQPDNGPLHELLVITLLTAKKGEAALAAIGGLVPKAPADVLKVLSWRARAYALHGQLENGVNDLTSLLEEQYIQENATARTQVRQEILTLLIEAGDTDRALRLCERWLADVPPLDRSGRIGALLLKRMVLVSAGRLDEQVAITEELLKVQPYDAGLNNDLGYTLVEQGAQLARALGMIQLAVATEPLNSAYLDSLGWAYYRTGDFALARLHLERAVRLLTGRDATVRDHLGDAAFRLGDRDAARASWQAALDHLTAQPAEKPAPREIELLGRLRGKLAALAAGSPPTVAPTAAEQPATRPESHKEQP